jgi:hypothetical protein
MMSGRRLSPPGCRLGFTSMFQIQPPSSAIRTIGISNSGVLDTCIQATSIDFGRGNVQLKVPETNTLRGS